MKTKEELQKNKVEQYVNSHDWGDISMIEKLKNTIIFDRREGKDTSELEEQYNNLV